MDKFGEKLREIRRRHGMGLKRFAPQVGFDHTYISKVETGKVGPSRRVVDRVASYFEANSDELRVAADMVPDDVMDILRRHPREAMALLREKFGESQKP